MARPQRRARFRLRVGALRDARENGSPRSLAEQVSDEGRGIPDMSRMTRALSLWGFAAAVFWFGAPVREPLAAVFAVEHVGDRLDAHATLTASTAPRAFRAESPQEFRLTRGPQEARNFLAPAMLGPAGRSSVMDRIAIGQGRTSINQQSDRLRGPDQRCLVQGA